MYIYIYLYLYIYIYTLSRILWGTSFPHSPRRTARSAAKVVSPTSGVARNAGEAPPWTLALLFGGFRFRVLGFRG